MAKKEKKSIKDDGNVVTHMKSNLSTLSKISMEVTSLGANSYHWKATSKSNN